MNVQQFVMSMLCLLMVISRQDLIHKNIILIVLILEYIVLHGKVIKPNPD